MGEINIKDKTLDEFFDAIMMLNGREELQRFFEDVCTLRELHSISQRLEVAKLLKIRKTYSEIEKDTGASTATISRVNRSLQNGAKGYELVLDNLIAKNLEEKRKRKQK
ncbi:TrpR family protein YerC/YecD [Finegoldia magna]|uniref:YerC/YecD family TrpR-related protein n=1 Tax=Finegoldia magna TaxID=1260 RepID=UPI000B9184CF|nr:YerC/YecD family TrpR-related protein [Finegoldia magna]OXZ30445.1 TrpR family protein YerC/YecD [Finegoldia magna]